MSSSFVPSAWTGEDDAVIKEESLDSSAVSTSSSPYTGLGALLRGALCIAGDVITIDISWECSVRGRFSIRKDTCWVSLTSISFLSGLEEDDGSLSSCRFPMPWSNRLQNIWSRISAIRTNLASSASSLSSLGSRAIGMFCVGVILFILCGDTTRSEE